MTYQYICHQSERHLNDFTLNFVTGHYLRLWDFRLSRRRVWCLRVFWGVVRSRLVGVDRRFRGAYCPDDGCGTHVWNIGALNETTRCCIQDSKPHYLPQCFLHSSYCITYSVWLRAGRQGNRGSIPGKGERIFPLASVSIPAVGPTHPPIQCTGGPCHGAKARPGRDADHSPPSSAEVSQKSISVFCSNIYLDILTWPFARDFPTKCCMHFSSLQP
jgi:hypothetical protein